MDTVVKGLITLFNTILESSSDSQFYFNVYKYIDFIEKNKTLSKIIEKSESAYSKEFSKINKNCSPISDEAASLMDIQIRILEQNSLYAKDYAFLKTRIYDNTLWNEEDCNKKCNWYDNKRDRYQNRLNQFHATFLKTLEKPADFQFDLKTGDFIFYNTHGNLPLGGQEFKVFSTLYSSLDFQADYLRLIKSYNPTVEIAQKSHRDDLFVIIRNLKERLNILPATKTSNSDIFKNNKKIGYRLVFSPNDKNIE
jgi:hypothetical protein